MMKPQTWGVLLLVACAPQDGKSLTIAGVVDETDQDSVVQPDTPPADTTVPPADSGLSETGVDTANAPTDPGNLPPIALIVAPLDGATVDEGYLVELTGFANDVDHDRSELTWTMVGPVSACGGLVSNPDGEVVCEMVVPLGAPDMDVTFTVLDPEGGVGEDMVTLTVVPSGTPGVMLSVPPAPAYYSDRPVSLSGLVSDAEDDATVLDLLWTSTLDGLLPLPASADATGYAGGSTLLSEGQHVIKLSATDTTGLTGMDEVLLTVGPPNTAPSCGWTAPTTGALYVPGTPVTLEAQVSDPDVAATVLQVTWTSDVDGVLGVSTPSLTGDVNLQVASLSAQPHQLTLVVEDELGAACTDTVDVGLATPPTVQWVLPAANTVFEVGGSVDLQVLVADDESAPTAIDLVWVSSIDGPLSTQGPDGTGVADVVMSNLSPGDHALTVTASDPQGLTATASRDIRINIPPVLGSVAVSPAAVEVGDELVCSAVATDPDGAPPTLSYSWSNGATGAVLTVSSSDAPGAVLECTVTATDGDGSSVSGVAGATVLNSPPTLSNVAISPVPAFNDSVLVCGGDGLDANDGTLPVTVAWGNVTTGVAYGAGPTLALSSGLADSLDTIGCEATVTDSQGLTQVVTTSTTLANRDPEVSLGVTSSQQPALPTSTLTCTASASDADGDAITVTMGWLVDGTQVVSSITGTSQTLSGAFGSGSEVSCVALVTDGKGGSSDATETLTIGGAPPVIDDLSFEPAIPLTDDDLTAEAVVSDADGDMVTLTYTWSVNGVQVQSGASSTLDGTVWFSRGDTVDVVVIAEDTTGEFGAATLSTVVGNTPPGAPEVEISPDVPEDDDELLCTVTTAAADSDNDSVGYTMTWTVNGDPVDASVLSETVWPGDTVDGDEVAPAQVWSCTAVANDGTDSGGSATDTVETENPLEGQDCTIVADGGSVYGFCEDQVTWYTAEFVCDEAGGNLVTINNASENAFLLSTALALRPDTATDGNVAWWIGYTDEDSEGNFEWVSGSSSGYTNWNSGEPNDAGFGGEDCAVLSYFGGDWNDLPCWFSFSSYQTFICEFD